MILTGENNSFETSIPAKNEFKIKTSAKAFKILSDSLYSNKSKSIIRELSCNAYDSHVAANKKTIPFLVKLPTIFEKTFTIRDYGTGLSKNDVETLYTTYFESTKNDSNDFIGALGLGSKSPFSYTDTFSIISYYNEMKYSYVATLINGFPTLMELSEENTTEMNGMEISFSVKDENFRDFEYYAKEVFEIFETRPIINTTFNFTDFDTVYLQYEHFAFRKSSSTKIFAVQGNVSYPIDISLIETSDTFKKFKQNGIGSLYINFNIGKLDVSPSRESLSYNEETKKNIQEKIDYLEKTLEKQLIFLIKEQKTIFQFLNHYEFFRKNHFFKYYLPKNVLENKNNYFTHIEIEILKKMNINLPVDDYKTECYLYSYDKRNKITYNNRYGSKIAPVDILYEKGIEKVIFLYIDTQKNNVKNIKKLFEDGYKKIFLLVGNIKVIEYLETFFCETINLEYNSKLSEKKVRTKKNYENSYFLKLNEYKNFVPTKKSDIDTEKVKFYIPYYNQEPVLDFESLIPINVQRIVFVYQYLFKNKTIELYGIRKSGLTSTIKKDKTWINIQEYLKNEINKKTFQRKYFYTNTSNNYMVTKNNTNVMDYIAKKTTHSGFKKLVKSFEIFEKKQEKNDFEYRNFISKINNVVSPDTSEFMNKYCISKTNDKQCIYFLKQYPLLSHFFSKTVNFNVYYLSDNEKNILDDYISYLETKEKKNGK